MSITVSEDIEKKFLGITIKSKNVYEFILSYRVSENRFWYYKIINNKVIDSHHTKNGLSDSLRIMENILDRISLIDLFGTKRIKITDVFRLESKVTYSTLFKKIQELSNEKENYIEKKKQPVEDKLPEKKRISGIFLR